MEESPSSIFSKRENFEAIVFKNKIWVIGGADPVYEDGVSDIWSSIDRQDWTLENGSTPFGGRVLHRCTVFEDKLWLSGGKTFLSIQKDLWCSSDGVTWSEVPMGPTNFSYRKAHGMVAFNNKLWIIGGYAYITGVGSMATNDIWCSSDGTNWSLVRKNAAFPPRFSHTTLVADNRIWVIGGTDLQNNYYNDVWVSSNGADWEKAADNPLYSPRHGHAGAVHLGNIYILGGMTENGYTNDVWVIKP